MSADPEDRFDDDNSPDGEVILSVRDLRVDLVSHRGEGCAVDGISFDLHRGETLGLVGESGSGKSMTSLAIVGLTPQPTARVSGEVRFRGKDLLKISRRDLARYRGRHLAMILQDPTAALNPVYSIANQIYEPLRLHQGLRRGQLKERAISLLDVMRIPSPEARLRNYPHQLSGGMRQRVVGAIALSGRPEILIADEPTTSLDVTIQASYLALLKRIQRTEELSILFITHDFGVVGSICHRVAVMYAGRIVEIGTTWTVFESPAHPYTKALLSSVPDVQVKTDRLPSIEGSPPSAFRSDDERRGCAFRTRCWLYRELGEPPSCANVDPLLTVSDTAGHSSACHFPSEARGREVPVDIGETSRAAGSSAGRRSPSESE